DLSNCKSHLSYYVALSRGTTAEATVILEGFKEKKITSGLSGYLRQELREIDILDEITWLKFEGRLPIHITGLYWQHLIRSFQIWTGANYKVQGLHEAIKWCAEMGPWVPDRVAYMNPIVEPPKIKKAKPSKFLKQKKETRSAVDTPAAAICSPLPPNHLGPAENRSGPPKRRRTEEVPSSWLGAGEPTGMIWDSVDFSCAYGSFFTVLWELWRQKPLLRTSQLQNRSPELDKLMDRFSTVLRSSLMVPVYAGVDEVVLTILGSHVYGTAVVKCHCGQGTMYSVIL
ncbi:hypothetical protein C8J57DRAFT_1094159, partial [Mycena rebaudengoi]